MEIQHVILQVTPLELYISVIKKNEEGLGEHLEGPRFRQSRQLHSTKEPGPAGPALIFIIVYSPLIQNPPAHYI